MGADHGHGLDAGPLRRGLVVGVCVVALVAVVGAVLLWPRGEAPSLYDGASPFDHVDATVIAVAHDECLSPEVVALPTECQVVDARLTSGRYEGDVATFRIYGTDFSQPELALGDKVVLLERADTPAEFRYSYFDRQRDAPLLWLLGLFVVVVVAFGRWRGLRALAGIAVSFAVLLGFMLPALLRGSPGLPVALVATAAIALTALYVAHGFSTGTTIALVGTLVSLLVVAGLALLFVNAAGLTGLVGEEAQILRVTADAIDLRGLLVAGIIVGALGVLDDVTVTQVATVVELRRANPAMGRRTLFQAASRVGRDHIASTVNTLVLAYAGASLPILLFFLEGGMPWGRAIASEIVAMEIIRTLVGSIGLVLAVPVTTALAALAITPRDPSALDMAGGDDQPDDETSGSADWASFSPEQERW